MYGGVCECQDGYFADQGRCSLLRRVGDNCTGEGQCTDTAQCSVSRGQGQCVCVEGGGECMCMCERG